MGGYQPIGGEVELVNFGSVDAVGPHITGLAGGGSVVTFESEDPSDTGVYARVFSATGEGIGGPFLVNSNYSGSQNSPDVTALAGGGFVIAFTDNLGGGGDDSQSAVLGQVFTATGNRVGGEFLINTTVENSQFEPAISSLANGGFVVSWTDNSGSADPYAFDLRAQQFSAAGAKVGPEVFVPQIAEGTQRDSDVAGLAGGGFVTVWADDSGDVGDASGRAVVARVFDASSNPVGGEFLVNESTAGDQDAPSIAALEGGGFVVTWQDASGQNGDPDPLGVKARLLSAAGVALGDEFLVNTTTARDQAEPTVTALPGGGFAISWTDSSISAANDPYERDSLIRLQVFDASGVKQGGELQVNTTEGGTQSDPTITLLANGDLFVAWDDPTGYNGTNLIHGQAFRLQSDEPGTNDVLTGGAGADTLDGRNGDDTLSGLGGDDLLYGGAGDDVLKGGLGDDLLSGGAGIDTADYADLRGTGVTVSLAITTAQDTGGAGRDTLSGIENLRGSRGDDTLTGDDGANRIKGETGNDHLFGAGGDDFLFGDGGDDVLNGGAGFDTLAGGAGVDRFVFDSLDGDLVKDWQHGEKIDFSALGGGVLLLETRFGRTYAGFDNNGDGLFDNGFIVIQAVGLHASDFVLT